MNPDDHIGQGHESEPYVGLLRGISQEVHDHALRMARSESFDIGWRAACEQLETDLKRNKREFGKRIEDRCWREIRRQQRADRFQALAGLALCVVIVAALIFMKG